jgi:uncharacterized protein (TIGR02444 family)
MPPSIPAFWRFSTRVYRLPRVSEILLRLQDDAGFDVNLALFGIFAATRVPTRLAPAIIAKAAEMSQAWTFPIVRPLRQARRALRASDFGADGEREQIGSRLQRLELDAEKLFQSGLAELLPKKGEIEANPDVAEANILALETGVGALIGPRTRTSIRTLVGLCLGRDDLQIGPPPIVSSGVRPSQRGPKRVRQTDRSDPRSIVARRRRRGRVGR